VTIRKIRITSRTSINGMKLISGSSRNARGLNFIYETPSEPQMNTDTHR
jgi:hypothetical protein